METRAHVTIGEGLREGPGFREYRRHLPHWRVAGCVYFVTWRLHPEQPRLSMDERVCVLEVLRRFEDERYVLPAAVVMDDHVHALVRMLGGRRLEEACHGWKSVSAHRLQKEHGRVGRLWQAESCDHVVRGPRELIAIAQYICGNPVARWPELRVYPALHVRERDWDAVPEPDR